MKNHLVNEQNLTENHDMFKKLVGGFEQFLFSISYMG